MANYKTMNVTATPNSNNKPCCLEASQLTDFELARVTYEMQSGLL